MTVTTLQDRLTIQKLSQQGLTDRQIAEQLGFRLPTIRKWRRRLVSQGRDGLDSRMGRPVRGALSTFRDRIVKQLGVWCKKHPGWGAKTLRAELQRAAEFEGLRLPSTASIGRWLKAAHQTRLYEKHSELPEQGCSSAQACHEEWELDAKGYQRVAGLGLISLIDINDAFSHVRILSHPCWSGRERVERLPSTEDYQQALRLAFSTWGLPERLATDHDRIFYDETSKSPFPTRFHLWLIALGIQLAFGRLSKPTDQGMTERSHQLWEQQVLQGSCFENLQALRHSLNQRQIFLNRYLPCASLGERPPLVAHPEAEHPRRPYRPEWEADLLNLEPVYAYLSQGQWFRKVSAVGTLSIGRHIYHMGYDWRPDGYAEITFDPASQHFHCRSASGKEKVLPAAWLTKTELMGELAPILQLPEFQVALPFSWKDWRVLMYLQPPALPHTDTTF